jgi:diacylglycerol kinase (ATP)
MRIALFYNERAGGSPPATDLRDVIRQGGHSIVQAVNLHDNARPAFDPSTDVVVAAGGDGTVSRAATLVAATKLPLAILPVGTANNIARSLGIEGTITELVAAWRRAAPVLVDMGHIEWDAGAQTFLEGIGGGLVPSVIKAMQREPASDDEQPEEEVDRAVRRYQDLLPALAPQRWTLTADGVRCEDDLLLFEVLNMVSIGPNLTFSPETSATDGLLSVVTVGEEHRKDLAALLDAHLNGYTPPCRLPVVHARHVVIEGIDAVHIDDRVHPPHGRRTLSARIKPAALTLLR